MKKPLLYLLMCLSMSWSSFAQKRTEPTQEDKILAKTLKEKYPDDHLALQDSYDYVTFDLDKGEKKVTVKRETKTTLMNIDPRVNIQKYCFYNGESEITDFEVSYRNGRNTWFDVKDEAYSSNDLFHHDMRVQYVNLDFPLNAYKYRTSITKEYKDIKYFTKLYFNDDYPTLQKVIKIEVPAWLDVELKEMNFEGHEIQISKVEKNNGLEYTYTLNDIPASSNEKNAPGPSHIYPHILVLPKSFSADGETISIFNSTQDLYNWYKSLVDDLENDNSDLKEKVIELTKDAETDEEKIKNIYYWVQDNIRYIAFEDGIAGFKPEEANNVFRNRYGDCKGMANLTKQMLLEAGFDARLTWIGTKHIAYDYSTPNLSVDNHMICTVFNKGSKLFLDGTEKFNALGEYADRIQGKQALIENGNEYILEYIPVNKPEFNIEKVNYEMKLVDENIIGTVKKEFHGESRANLLNYFNSLKNDKKDEFLEWYLNNGDSNIKVSDINTSDLSDREAEIDINYNIAVKNSVSSFDNALYIDLDLDKELSSYDLEKRKTSYIFGSKKDLESTTKLQVPKGYKISYLPKSISIKSKNYDLSVDIYAKGNTIIYHKNFKIKNGKIDKTDFEEWNAFIQKLNDVYNDQVILTKA